MILAFDTATPACTAALFAADGSLIDRRDEVMTRGHAERLVPMLEKLLGRHRPSAILVGCGPGSFTGLRVGIAAAHGLALGWNIPVAGFATCALLAAGVPGDGPLGIALPGGHGELFVQQFDRAPLRATSELVNLPIAKAAAFITAHRVAGPAAAALIAARGAGEAIDRLPAAADVMALPEPLRRAAPRPLYIRDPDARPRAA